VTLKCSADSKLYVKYDHFGINNDQFLLIFFKSYLFDTFDRNIQNEVTYQYFLKILEWKLETNYLGV